MSDVVIDLPDALAKVAREAGLLTSDYVASMFRREIRRRGINKLFSAADRLASVTRTMMITKARRQGRGDYRKLRNFSEKAGFVNRTVREARDIRKFVAFLLAFLLGISLIPDSPPDVGRDDVPNDITEAVSEYWSLSKAEGISTGIDAVGVTPTTFYAESARCSKISDKDFLGGPSAANLIRQVVDEGVKTMHRESLDRLSARIARENMTHFRLSDFQVFSDHAAVRVQFGSTESAVNQGYFLFHNSNGRYRLFLFDTGEYLSWDNRYFGQASCDATPITELAWE